jgi:hypothetical protein
VQAGNDLEKAALFALQKIVQEKDYTEQLIAHPRGMGSKLSYQSTSTFLGETKKSTRRRCSLTSTVYRHHELGMCLDSFVDAQYFRQVDWQCKSSYKSGCKRLVRDARMEAGTI